MPNKGEKKKRSFPKLPVLLNIVLKPAGTAASECERCLPGSPVTAGFTWIPVLRIDTEDIVNF